MLHWKMFQWQEATSAIRLWKDPKIWVSWKLNSAQECWYIVKRRQKYLLLWSADFALVDFFTSLWILGAAMHKFDLWLCYCMAGWLRWQAVSVVCWSSSVVEAPLQIFAHHCAVKSWSQPWVLSSLALQAEMIATFGIDEQVCLKWLEPLYSSLIEEPCCQPWPVLCQLDRAS